MDSYKSHLLRMSSWLYSNRALSVPQNALTTLLYHRFFGAGETLADGRARLRRQLDWLCNRYQAVTCDDAVAGLSRGSLPPLSLTVTADDVRTELLQVYDIFAEYRVPVTAFVCTGWADNNEPEQKASIGRVVDFVQFWEGADKRFDLGKYGVVDLARASRGALIDWLILQFREHGDAFTGHTWEIFLRHRPTPGPRVLCSWDELADLHQRGGVSIGSHSVTHCRLAQVTPTRLGFELAESKRAIEERLAGCNLFAYPFGTRDVVNEATSIAVRNAGYTCAFLTHAGFAGSGSDIYHLPRLVIPDEKIALPEYRARARGGQIPFDRLTGLLRPHGATPPPSSS